MSAKKIKPFKIHKKVSPDDWIEVKYEGITYLVCVRSLLNCYNQLERIAS